MALEYESPKENVPTLDEYDDEPSPMPVSYCRRLTQEEYDAQTSTETERAIEDLITMMEKNPELYRRVLQRRRREEMENGGIMSFLKARALYFWQRDDGFHVPDEECKTKTKKLHSEMTRVFNYSQGLREGNRRQSARLAKKQKSTQLACKNSTQGKESPKSSKSPVQALTVSIARRYKKSPLAQSSVSTPPAPPPAPPIPDSLAQSMEMLQRQPIASRRQATGLRTSTKRTSPSASCRPRAQTQPGTGSHDALMGALKDSSVKRSLRHVDCDRSPGGTPVKRSKRRTPADYGEETSLFNVQLLHKFRNANLRSPSPTVHNASSTSWFSSPES